MVNPYALTSNLYKIITTKPANFAQHLQRFDSFTRHPSVWPFFVGSTIGLAMILYIVKSPSEDTVRSSAFVNRTVMMELYKKKEGHYPH